MTDENQSIIPNRNLLTIRVSKTKTSYETCPALCILKQEIWKRGITHYRTIEPKNHRTLEPDFIDLTSRHHFQGEYPVRRIYTVDLIRYYSRAISHRPSPFTIHPSPFSHRFSATFTIHDSSFTIFSSL